MPRPDIFHVKWMPAFRAVAESPNLVIASAAKRSRRSQIMTLEIASLRSQWLQLHSATLCFAGMKVKNYFTSHLLHTLFI